MNNQDKYVLSFTQNKQELEFHWQDQITAISHETFDNVASVLFGIRETTPEEEELLKGILIFVSWY